MQLYEQCGNGCVNCAAMRECTEGRKEMAKSEKRTV